MSFATSYTRLEIEKLIMPSIVKSLFLKDVSSLIVSSLNPANVKLSSNIFTLTVLVKRNSVKHVSLTSLRCMKMNASGRVLMGIFAVEID